MSGWRALAVVLAGAVVVAALVVRFGPDGSSTSEELPEASYVGRGACASCHAEEERLWSGSHHDLAMQEATTETVLGDFDEATLTADGVIWTFLRADDGSFLARTTAPDGRTVGYDIRYTFGVDPLQQYLVTFPGGRLQALDIAWDSRPAEVGGRRWFDLREGLDIEPEHPLHWARRERSWNTACAECHSTGVRKGFDLDSRSYSTTWAEIDVSCEACHGPGSEHVRVAREVERGGAVPGSGGWAVSASVPDAGRAWAFGAGASTADRAESRKVDAEIQSCAHCHSRRSSIDDGWTAGEPLLDTDVPSLLRGDLYHPDGQILDEVYVYGSFVQSRMHRAGVTCSDCHEPHALTLRSEGNALCTRCHLADAYDAPSHHFHAANSEGARCVECHMPATTYMEVDPRRDHSLRIPRPDLAGRTGAPDACTRCHEDREPAWAAGIVEGWYGPSDTSRPHFSEVIARARQGDPRVTPELARIATDTMYAGIVRGTALSLLGPHFPGSADPAIRAGLADPDPLVRLGAADALRGRSEPTLVEAAIPLVDDSLRAIRIGAARLLAALPPGLLAPDRLTGLEGALEDFEDSRRVHGDHPESWVSLGDLRADRGEVGPAEEAYRVALALDSGYVAAYVNLADLYRASGRTADEEDLLRGAVAALPDHADVQHALGLMWVRRGDLTRALDRLGRAARSDPGTSRYSYVYGVALTSAGEMERGMQVLREAAERHPFDRDLLIALATLSREAGERAVAVGYAERLAELFPEDAEARTLLAQLRSSPG